MPRVYSNSTGQLISLGLVNYFDLQIHLENSVWGISKVPAAGRSSRMADLGAQQTTLELGQRKRSVISALPNEKICLVLPHDTMWNLNTILRKSY